jgi:hypothetical protein
MVTKKKAVKKRTAKADPRLAAVSAALTNNKLHVVMGEGMVGYVAACEDVGMTKSEVARLLCTSFVEGGIKITPAKASQKKAIKA